MSVLIGMPSYDGRIDFRVSSKIASELMTVQNASLSVPDQRYLHQRRGSILDHVFNSIFCVALNNRDRFKWFLLCHADVLPCGNEVINRMIRIAEDLQADALSAVIPIKDDKGLTSTGLQWVTPECVARRRRLTLSELYALPETFGAKELAELFKVVHSYWLLFNTGLLLLRLSHPAIERMSFSTMATIRKNEAGLFVPLVNPEDWSFSQQASVNGLRCFATRAIEVRHLGEQEYSNAPGFGSWEMDHDYEKVELP